MLGSSRLLSPRNSPKPGGTDSAPIPRRTAAGSDPTSGDTQAVVGEVQTARQHLERGDIPAAARACTACLHLGVDPAQVRALAEDLATAWRTAAEQTSDHDSWFQLAVFLRSVGRSDAALADLEELATRVPAVTASAHFHSLRGLCLRDTGEPGDAAAAFRQALQHSPAQPADEAGRGARARLLRRLATCLARTNEAEEAWQLSAEADALEPPDAEAAFADLMLLPVTYTDTAQITRVRERFGERLAGLRDALDLSDADARRRAVAAIRSPYYLHYQGGPDLPHQAQYGQLVHEVLASWRPDLAAPPEMPPVEAPLRIGFASHMLHSHSVTKLFGGWALGLDPQHFAVHAYHLGHRQDAVTRSFRDRCAAYADLGGMGVDAMCTRIRADRLHALIFPELGMSATTLQLAGLRSAPLQCVAWGHPVTSGLPSVDVMLSSAAMEPEGAEASYTEELVRLPGLSIEFAAPEMSPQQKWRADFGLGDEDFVYLVPQSLQKLLPGEDPIYARIAAAVPRARFVFLADADALVTRSVETRMSRCFLAAGLDPAQHLRFVPQLSFADYLDLNRCGDVFLDGLTWSGGVTTLEAVHCGLVPVTCPGNMMRSRHTAAILGRLDVTDTIASSPDEFVAIAIRLAEVPGFAADLALRIRAGLPRIQEDPRVIPELERFLTAAVRARA